MFITTYFPDSGETAAQFTAQRCRDVLTKAIGEPIDVEIIDVAPWQPYEQVADQFQSGRVFLVGDSAHTMPPFKAGGANTAIQSAHNLAWKLAAVLNGTADPALLATYHAERYPVGRFNARQSLTGPALAFLRIDDNRPQLPADEEAPMFAVLIGYQYRSAAVIFDDPAPADPDAVSLVDELRAQPGTRVPHAWVQLRGPTHLDARLGRTRLHAFHRFVRRALGERSRCSIHRAECPDQRAQHRRRRRDRRHRRSMGRTNGFIVR